MDGFWLEKKDFWEHCKGLREPKREQMTGGVGERPEKRAGSGSTKKAGEKRETLPSFMNPMFVTFT